MIIEDRQYQSDGVNYAMYHGIDDRIIHCAPTGCHLAGTVILMADGSLQHVQHIRVGDFVMGPDSGARKVLDLHTGQDVMYRIVPTKGEIFTVNGDHILAVRVTNDGSKHEGDCELVTPREWVDKSRTFKHTRKIFRVGVDFPENGDSYPLGPYFVGVLLGDGGLKYGRVGVTTADPEIVHELEGQAEKYRLSLRKEPAGGSSFTYHFTAGRSGSKKDPNYVLWATRQIGIQELGSGEKAIPERYRRASRHHRLEILAGLMDTDGSLSGGGYDYISKSHQLSMDVAFLARSLGLAAYITQCVKTCGDFSAEYSRVSISGDCSVIPCRIERKRAPKRLQKKNVLVTGFAVEKLREGHYYGFECSGDGLYVMGDFTVTHNSGKTVMQAQICKREMDRGNSTAILTPRNEIFTQTHSMVAEICGLENVSILRAKREGETWNPVNPVHIVSWPTLIARARRSKFWFPDVRRVQVDECFTGDMEILTENGFVEFRKLKPGKVAQVGRSGSISFVDPLRYIWKPYAGEMVRWRSKQTIDVTVTPDHEMLRTWLSASGTLRHYKYPAKKMNKRWMIPVAAWCESGTESLTSMERLIIALQADGSIRRTTSKGHSIDFHFSKQRKIDRLKEICADGDFRLSEVSGGAGKRRFLVHRLVPVSKRLQDTFLLSEISQAKAKAIIEEMVCWDGNINSRTGQYYFSSTDEQSTDFYQAVAIMAGYKTNKTLQVDERKTQFKDVHRLFISKDRNVIGLQSAKKETVFHHGHVYCVEVPSGQIVVRRNGKCIITGNCHLSMAPKILEILEHYAPKAVLDGWTATPSRQSGKGLGRFFTEIKHVTTVRQLVKDGHLCPAEYWGGATPDMAGIRIVRGDYEVGKLSRASIKLVGDVVDNWLRLAADRHTIVFSVDIAHCEMLAHRFKSVGVNAAALHTNMSDEDRDEVVKQFKAGHIQVLVNVQIASYGFDDPSVNCIVIARKTRSIVLHLQMIGRGMRPAVDEDGNIIRDPDHPGFKILMVLDHAGNVPALGMASDLFRWRLDQGRKASARVNEKGEPEEPTSHVCEDCGHIFSQARVCPQCGWKVPLTKKDVDTVDADLVRIGKKLVEKLPEGWPSHEIFYCMLAKYGADKGYKPGWASVKYKERTGVWPERHWLNMASVPPSKRILNWITSRNIAYREGQKAKRAAGVSR